MLFGSAVFLFVFLPAVLLLHLVLPRPLKNGMLLLASLLFYAWGEPFFVLVMLASLAGNWLFGLAVDARRESRLVMGTAVAFNLGLLGTFKYANFVWGNVAAGLAALGTGIELGELDPIPLPIGISFFTFQALSYLVDVRRNTGPAQRNPIDFALYVSMFPQLIAGPIVRYHDVATQLVQRVVTRDGFAYGVRRFIIGLGKKLLIADVAGFTSDQVFALPVGEVPMTTAWLGTVAFTIQVYFDFSGYSDMAIGIGRMLGFRFLENFDYPLSSKSITELWRRWHISLTNWFRDYLYIPMGGNRGGAVRTSFNLMTVFLLCGLWHGASWTFLIFGFYNGFFLMIERGGLFAALARMPVFVRHVYTLLVWVIGMTMFRAETMTQFGHHVLALFGAGPGASVHTAAIHLNPMIITVLIAGAITAFPVWPKVKRWRERLVAEGSTSLDTCLELGQVVAVCVVFIASLLQVSAGTYSPFIYFRF
jgi:alginate O-acetyltransferase complex protein AlgI